MLLNNIIFMIFAVSDVIVDTIRRYGIVLGPKCRCT